MKFTKCLALAAALGLMAPAAHAQTETLGGLGVGTAVVGGIAATIFITAITDDDDAATTSTD